MVVIKDVPIGTVVKFPDDTYERGSIMLKTSIVNKFRYTNGSIGETCLFIAMNDSDICDCGDIYWLAADSSYESLEYPVIIESLIKEV